jgi:hypothetical protein
MWSIPALSWLKSAGDQRPKRRPHRNFTPLLECLEDRRLLSTLVEAGVNPSTGSPGAIVQVSGSGFVSGSQVFFGSKLASPSGSQSAILLTVAVPSVPVGSTDVKVVNPDGQQAILVGAFFTLPGGTGGSGSNPGTPGSPTAPVVTSIAPGSGVATGGTTVTIGGTGFQTTTKVFFGGVAGTIVGIPTSTSITVVTPALPVGPADVKVVNPDGQQVIVTGGFSATATPPASSGPLVLGTINPNVGVPGQVIQLFGAGFLPTSKVSIGGVAAAFSGEQTATTLNVIVPSLPVGAADVKIVNPDGTQVVAPGGLTVLFSVAPIISNVLPHFGQTPGTVLTITGTGFQSGTKVFFGTIPGTISGTTTNTTLTVVTPPLPIGSNDVKVVNPDGQQAVLAGGFFALGGGSGIAAPPAISSISPNSGLATGGTTVTITGTGFQSGSKVFFGGVAATLSGIPNTTTITAISPVLPVGAADVKVVNPDSQQSVLVAGFLALATPTASPPVVSSVGPHAGPPSTVITITGSGFQAGSQVFIGGVAATLTGIETAGSLSAIVPSLPLGAADVTVVNPDKQQSTLKGGFVVQGAPPPVISNLIPHFGHTPGVVITIVGTGFQTGSKVTLGTIAVPLSGTATPTSLTVVAPDLPVGPTDVKVVNPDGQQAIALGAFFAQGGGGVIGAPPVVTSISPTSGPTTGGTQVIITGTGFLATSKVFFGGVAATVVGIPTFTSITVLTPALPAGAADVKVVNPDTQQSILAGGFVAQAPASPSAPTITSIIPNSGPTTGGTVVTLSGTNFQPTSQVLIGGFAATISGTPTANSITVVTPALPAGAADVKVVNSDGQFALVSGGFTATNGTLPPGTGAPPVVTGIGPNAASGGTGATVSGTGFQAGSQVLIGGVAAVITGTPSAIRINITIPTKLPIGPADVEVLNPDGQKSVLPGALFVLP